MVILNSNTFHLHLKNNFHSTLSLPFKILLNNLHGLMDALYSIYCYLVLPFFLMLTSLPLWFMEFSLRWILCPFGVCHDLLATCLALVFEKGSSCIDRLAADSWFSCLQSPKSWDDRPVPPPASLHPLHASLLSGTVGQVQAVLVVLLPWFGDQPFFLLVENRICFLFCFVLFRFGFFFFKVNWNLIPRTNFQVYCLPSTENRFYSPARAAPAESVVQFTSFLLSIATSSSASFS